MNKKIGLIVLTAGIAITAGTGSQLSPEFKVEMAKTGDAHFRKDRSQRRHTAYCKARKKAGMKLAEGCSSKKGRTTHLIKPHRLENISEVKRTGRMLKVLKRRSAKMPEEVAKKRNAWIKALKQERKAHKRVEKQGTQSPGARLSGWAGQAGPGFGLGLLLVIAGAWICRVAIREEMTQTGQGDEAGPVDFGALLGDVQARVHALHAEMLGLEAPTVSDLEALKVKLEEIQKGDLARLCESGPRVQQRYGQGGFAEIFSPLSAAERKLNRVWATLVDRHWPEAMASIQGATEALTEAQAALAQLGSD